MTTERKRYMTAKQAWLFLAKKYDKGRCAPYTLCGLCFALKRLSHKGDGRITYATWQTMYDALYAHRPRRSIDQDGAFFWPYDEHGAKARAAFCRRRAAECAKRKVKP